jgi:hypothetical protein
MKIIKQGLALSDEDLNLIKPDTVTTMMKHRLVVEFDEAPDLDHLNFSGCQGFYYIKSLGSKLYQFWFENKHDFDTFYHNLIAYKMSLNIDDK